MLCADVFILEPLRLLECRLEELGNCLAQMLVSGPAPRHLRELLDRLVDLDFDIVEVRTDLLKDRGNDSLAILYEGGEEMLGLDRLVGIVGSDLLRALDRFLRFNGKFIEVHSVPTL